MTAALEFCAAVDREGIPTGQTSTAIECELQIRPAGALLAADEVATRICLVLDCSASMRAKMMRAAMAAAKTIVDTVNEAQCLSLVAFSTRSKILIDNQVASSDNKEAIKRRIDRLQDMPRGTTNLTAGIDQAVEVLSRGPADAKIMIILTDGEANCPERALRAAMAATEAGAQIFAVGIGDYYAADHLLKLVTPSGGAVFGDSDPEQVTTAFGQLAARIRNFVATDVHIDLALCHTVEWLQAHKTEPEQAFIGDLEPDENGRVRIMVGNVERDKTYTFVLELDAPAKEPGEHEIARAWLHYQVPALGLRDERQEIAIHLHYKGPDATRVGKRTRVHRRADIPALVVRCAEANKKRQGNRVRACLAQIIGCCEGIGDDELKGHFVALLGELDKKGSMSQAAFNRAVVASTASKVRKNTPKPGLIAAVEPENTVVDRPVPQAAPEPPTVSANPEAADADAARPAAPTPTTTPEPGGPLYDLVLVEPVASPIRLVREIRHASGLNLREVADMVRVGQARVGMPLAEIKALRDRIASFGVQSTIARHGGDRA